jgi:hypothetical protein
VPIIPALRRLRQEDHVFEASLGLKKRDFVSLNKNKNMTYGVGKYCKNSEEGGKTWNGQFNLIEEV